MFIIHKIHSVLCALQPIGLCHNILNSKYFRTPHILALWWVTLTMCNGGIVIWHDFVQCEQCTTK